MKTLLATLLSCFLIFCAGIPFYGQQAGSLPAGGGGAPGGSNFQIQYNNNGAFGGSSVISTNPAGTSLTVTGVNGQSPTMSVTSPGSGQVTVLQLTGSAANTQPVLNVSGGSGLIQSVVYGTATNCSSSASPAVCGSAAAGSFVIAAGATTVTVNTTAVTANSSIIPIEDDSLGTKLSVTCNTATAVPEPNVTARVAATSFSVAITVTPVTNPKCYSYFIVN